MPSSEDYAWAAGLFEGEGCLTWNRQRNGRRYPHVTLRMTDEDVVRRFAAIMDIGSVTGPRTSPGRKPIWNWRATGPKALERVNETIAPWLGERRQAKLAEMLEFESRRAPDGTWLQPREFSTEGMSSLVDAGRVGAGLRVRDERGRLRGRKVAAAQQRET